MSGGNHNTNTGRGIYLLNDLAGNVKLGPVTIDSVTISDFGYDGISIYGLNGSSGWNSVTVTNSTLYANRDGIQSYANANNANQNILIDDVTAHDNDGLKNGYAGIEAWGTVANDEVDSNWVFAQSPASAGIRIASGALVLNLKFRNNTIFVTGNLPIVEGDTVSGVTFSGNDYWRTDGSFLVSWNGSTRSPTRSEASYPRLAFAYSSPTAQSLRRGQLCSVRRALCQARQSAATAAGRRARDLPIRSASYRLAQPSSPTGC